MELGNGMKDYLGALSRWLSNREVSKWIGWSVGWPAPLWTVRILKWETSPSYKQQLVAGVICFIQFFVTGTIRSSLLGLVPPPHIVLADSLALNRRDSCHIKQLAPDPDQPTQSCEVNCNVRAPMHTSAADRPKSSVKTMAAIYSRCALHRALVLQPSP